MATGRELPRRDLSRREMIGGLAAAASLLHPALGRAATEPDARLRQVMADTIAIDMHNHVYPTGISERRGGGLFGGMLGAAPASDAPLSLSQELRRAGLTAVCAEYELDFTPIEKPGDARVNYLRWIDALDRQLETERLRRAFTLKDLQAAHASGIPTLVHGIEGSQFIEGRLERIEEVYKRGLRHLQLLHDRDDIVSRLGDTDNGRDRGGGLTPFGRDVIGECNRLGVVVDLAHGSAGTIAAAAKISSAPFVVSHTGPAGSITDGRMGGLATRLLTRERASVVADAGGVIGVWTYPTDTIEQYVKNIRAMVTLAGTDHVGIGTDSNILSPQPGKSTNQIWRAQKSGFFSVVAAEMLRQGFTAEEIRKIGGGNYCRVFDRVTAGHA